MDYNLFIKFFMALLAINPFIGLPMFINLTKKETTRARTRTAFFICISYFVMMVALLFFGRELLSALSININAFRVAGGLILLYIAFLTLYPKENEEYRLADNEKTVKEKSIFYPLIMPVTFGPGTITTVIIYAHYNNSLNHFYSLMAATIMMLIILFIIFAISGTIYKIIGKNGLRIVSIIMGMLLAALAVNMIFEGIHTYFG